MVPSARDALPAGLEPHSSHVTRRCPSARRLLDGGSLYGDHRAGAAAPAATRIKPSTARRYHPLRLILGPEVRGGAGAPAVPSRAGAIRGGAAPRDLTQPAPKSMTMPTTCAGKPLNSVCSSTERPGASLNGSETSFPDLPRNTFYGGADSARGVRWRGSCRSGGAE